MAEYIDKKVVISIINTAGFWEEEDREVAITCVEQTKAADVAPVEHGLHALRPVSREQVEKVWRGCEKCNGAGEYSRYAENLTKILLAKYCPHCGRPLTDEAVDMVMERLEGME